MCICVNRLLVGITTRENLGKIVQPSIWEDQFPHPFNAHILLGDLFLLGCLWLPDLSSWINSMRVILPSCGSRPCSIGGDSEMEFTLFLWFLQNASQTRPGNYCQILLKKNLQHNKQASGNRILKSLSLKIHVPTQTPTSLVFSTFLSTFSL